MRTPLEKTEKGLTLVIPREMLAACGIRDEVNLSVEHGVLLVTAPGRKTLQGAQQAPARPDSRRDQTDEGHEALAHWNSLPEAPDEPEVQPRRANETVLKEEPKPYGPPGGQAGA